MTPFRNDEANPFSRPSIWPKMPQAPMSLGALPRASAPAPPPEPAPEPAPHPQVQVVEAEVAIAAAEAEMAIPAPPPAPEPPLELKPIAAPIGVRRTAQPHRALRLTPLVAAAAVGAGGMAALFLVLGVRPALAPAPKLAPGAPVPARSTLAVGDIVSAAGPPTPVPPTAPAASTQAAALGPAPRLALARSVPRHTAVAASAAGQDAAAPPLLQVPAVTAEPTAIPLQLPPPRPVASLAAPSEPPLTPAPTPAPYKPPPPLDRNAPIATHIPD
jgi:hypothetical protein